jgi:hypothetical protein
MGQVQGYLCPVLSHDLLDPPGMTPGLVSNTAIKLGDFQEQMCILTVPKA